MSLLTSTITKLHEVMSEFLPLITALLIYFLHHQPKSDTLNILQQEVVKFDFVKSGSHLGALGALINTVEEFLKVPSEVISNLKAVGETKDDAK